MTDTRTTTDTPIIRKRIDETEYDLLVVLASKLEALDAYKRFDSGRERDRELRDQLEQDDRRHADLLVDALRHRLVSAPRQSGPVSRSPISRSANARDARYAPDWMADRC